MTTAESAALRNTIAAKPRTWDKPRSVPPPDTLRQALHGTPTEETGQ